MATIYAPSTASTYYKKLAATQAVAPAAAAPTGQAMGGQGAITPFGSSNVMQNFYGAAANIPLGTSTIGQTQPGAGATIYEPGAVAPTPPTSTNSSKPGFMQPMQGYVVNKGAGAAPGYAATGATGGTAAAQPKAEDYSAIVAMLAQQTQAANQANEARYSQLLQNTDQFGQSAMQASQRQLTGELANNQQSLVNRGLANSTIVDTTRRGIQGDANARNTAVLGQVAQAKNNIIEARTDQAPDLSLYASLLGRPGGVDMANALLKATTKPTTKKK